MKHRALASGSGERRRLVRVAMEEEERRVRDCLPLPTSSCSSLCLLARDGEGGDVRVKRRLREGLTE
eukprot:scaffold4342_cov166-Ochromonas_danica.AAC.5